MAGSSVALVPTMGALHRGHRSLVDCARRSCDRVVVSIFVNPLQFGPSEDYSRYPRRLEADLAVLAEQKVDVCYAPDVAAVYPEGFATQVHCALTGLSRWEGQLRPGHFDGVATVVTKLFALLGPCSAYFGEKDIQQLAMVRRLARDLDAGTQVVGCPTVREEDGVAISSRNAMLSWRGRRAAGCLPAAWRAARSAYSAGERDGQRLGQLAAAEVAREALAELDYAVVVEDVEFEPVERANSHSRLLLAATIEGVRLIDNALLEE